VTTRTFPLTAPISLNARLGHGSVRVAAQDGLREATVTLTPRGDETVADRTTVQMDGATLSVLAPRQGGIPSLLAGWRRGDGVDAEISVPTGTPLKIATFTADVHVRGRVGDADVSTGTAAVELGVVDGDLRLRCGSSSSHVHHVLGSAAVKSGSGSVFFDELSGGLHCVLGSGDLDVGVVRGSLRSRTGSGNARLATVRADVDVAAGSGDVSIGVPAGFCAKLDVKTGAGRFRSELPVERERAGSGPTITVRARTGSGDIRLFRPAEAAGITT
jgi:hypothetical protein